MSATNGGLNLGGISHSTEPCTVLISHSAITKCRRGQKEMAKQIAGNAGTGAACWRRNAGHRASYSLIARWQDKEKERANEAS